MCASRAPESGAIRSESIGATLALAGAARLCSIAQPCERARFLVSELNGDKARFQRLLVSRQDLFGIAQTPRETRHSI